MSLHVLANHMASKGRDGDSMLVHMTPGEVHGLQALAMKHGGSLTINPDTGLPEANFLKSLLPMLAGFALGPAGFGLMSAGMAGLTVGGVTALATGSLSKGLMAGLGAYGGAGLGGGLSELGAAELAQGQISTNMPTLAEGASQAQIADYAKQVNDLRTAGLQGASQLPMADKLSAGFSSASASPMDAFNFAKDNKMALGMAAAPIMADMMVPTTTKSAPVQSPGRIREKRWDGTKFVDVASTDAGVYNTSNRSFSDLYRGYNNGGIVALAGGGDVKHFAIGDVVKADIDKAYAAGDYAKVNELAQANKITAADVADTYKGFDTSGLAGLGVNLYTPPAAPTYTQYTEDQMGSFLSNPVNKDIDLNKAIKDTNADPAAVNRYIASLTSPFVGSTESGRGSGTFGIYNQMVDKSISPDEYYAAAIANDPKYGGWSKDMIQEGYNLNKGMYALSDAKKGVVTDTDWAKLMVGNGTWDKPQYDPNEMAQATGLSIAEVRARYELEKLKANPIIKTIDNTKVTGTGTTTDTTTTPITYKTDGTNAPGGLESVLGLPPGVSGAGITTVNPNGTITTRPDLSLGMKTVRDDYVRGGGSLGYTSPVPTSLDAFNKTYVTDRMSGDSLAALNYLTGKAGATYPTKSGFAGQLSQDYATAVLGYPARGNLPYIYNKATGKMDPNPDYVAPGRNAAGDVTYSMSLNDIKNSLKDTPMSGQALYDWAMSNNLSAQQIADATGRSLSSVYADFRAGSKAKTTADKKKTDDDAAAAAANSQLDSSSTGGEAAGGLQQAYAMGGATGYALGGLGTLGGYSDGGRLLKGPGDGVSDSIPATIGRKQQPARLADGEFVVPARIVSELGNGSTDAGAKKLYAMMDRVQRARGKTTGKNKVAANSRADKYLPA